MAITTGFLPGDRIQARRVGTAHGPTADSDQYLVTEFIVTGTTGGRIKGSVFYPQGMDPADGWQFELISRPLFLPETVSEIDAVLFDDTVQVLVGKGSRWLDETGTPVRPEDIKAFTPHVDDEKDV